MVNPIPRKRHILSRREQATQDQNQQEIQIPPSSNSCRLPCQNPEEHTEAASYPVIPHERRLIPIPHRSPSHHRPSMAPTKAEKRKAAIFFHTLEPSSPPSSSAPPAPPHRHLPPASSGLSRGDLARELREPLPAAAPIRRRGRTDGRTTRRRGGEEWTTEEQKRRPLGLYAHRTVQRGWVVC